MRRIYLVLSALALTSLLPYTLTAQVRLEDLPPAHADTLRRFLSERPSLSFLSASAMDAAELAEARKHFGPDLMPYYRSGDFNRDGVKDFAVILARQGETYEQDGVTSGPHKYRHPLAVVVFNGQRRGGYRPALEKEIDAPLVCFLYLTFEKRRKLYFGVLATDEGFIVSPTRRGYKIIDTTL